MQGLKALEKRIEAMSKAARTDIKVSLDEGADRLVALQKSLAPRDRGDLIDSIEKRDGKHELAVEVTAGDEKAFYARMIEQGTARSLAQPFFFPAYRALKKSITARVNARIRKAAKREAGL